MSYEDKKYTESRSPLKASPLRYAGQSLDEEIDRIWDDDLMPYVVSAISIVGFAIQEWWK